MEITTKVMQQTTWQQILEDVKAGEAVKYAGTETEITLKDGTTAVLAVAAVNSNTQLYAQAGNSIVVNVLEEIFKNMIPKQCTNATERKAGTKSF